MRGIAQTLAGAVVLGVTSTVADLVWARWIPRHRAVFGLAHGAILCAVLGITLAALVGARRRRLLRAGAGEMALGLVAAGSFYVLQPQVGWNAMFAAWMLLWLLTAFLARGVAEIPEPIGTTVVRALVAAVLSGLAFWSISGIWLSPSPGGPDYLWNLVAWTFAFLPGFGALLLRRP